MSRTDGRKLVGIAVAMTVTALGVGTIYLPFVADRDKLRGLFEEGDDAVPEGARRQMKAMAKAEADEAERQRRSRDQTHQDEVREGQQLSREEMPQQQSRQKASAGSMWSSFRRSS
ncbi:hypothetical protein ACHAXA_011125 [Cyclostephanos tholiformis]|uniref:Uncharacterized protein n=1 Tax=Cyclostephanos tholiformis TaxID=382380 RepID=A0ABD3SEZ4_9STRA